MSDETKRLILARRARFVAAALASVGVACGKTNEEPPQPCLSVAFTASAPEPTPVPCLSVMYVPDAAADTDASADATDAGVADAASDAATTAKKDAGASANKPPITPKTATPPGPPPPQVCLSPAQPRKTTQ